MRDFFQRLFGEPSVKAPHLIEPVGPSKNDHLPAGIGVHVPSQTSHVGTYKKLFWDQFDSRAFMLGTASATMGRLVFYPVEATSFALQIGRAKTLREAIALNFNGGAQASFKGGMHLVKSAVWASGSYYGLGVAIMNPQKDKPILVQAAWGAVTVLPEQLSVVEATRTVRHRSGLSSHGISYMGWARINTGFFLRHLYGNPATFASVKTMERLFEEVVPERYHPLSSFIAGGAGVWLTHRCGYSFLVAVSVQLMAFPEGSFRSAWERAAQENYIKAGDVRAVGRMGTAAVVFCMLKYFGSEKRASTAEGILNTAPAGLSTASFFSRVDQREVSGIDEESYATYQKFRLIQD